MKKDRKRIYRIFLYVVLVMVVVGFTIPGFLELDGNQPQNTQPKICMSDSDCYLTCQDKPVAALCYQNLCQRKTCTEESFVFQAAPVKAELIITVNGTKLNLKEEYDQLSLSNFFVKFQTDSMELFSDKLRLKHVLDKLRMKLDAQCLTVGQENYCGNKNDEGKLQMLVNGEESYAYGEYIVEEGDKIEVKVK